MIGRRRAVVPHLEAVEARLCPSGLTPGLGVSRAFNGYQTYHIDNTITGRVDTIRSYGLASDVPVFGDFAGTTLTNIGVYRPSTGTWHLDLRNDGSTTIAVPFGGPGWLPVTGDIDGNGTTDLGVYNPSNGVWQFCTDLSGRASVSFGYGGSNGDVPLLADFNHDGKADPVIYNNGQWLVDTNSDRIPDQVYSFGGFAPGATPLIFDLYGTHDPALAVAAPQANGSLMWYINPNRDGRTVGRYNFGVAGDRPISGYFSTANSLFVNPSTGADVSGAGTYAAPYRTINAAVAAAAPGTSIRLMSGAYVENVQIIRKANLKIVGTGLQSSVIYPTRGDAVLVHSSDNISFDNLWFAAAGTDGRGLVLIGSSADTGLVRTNLTRWIGVLATDTPGRATTLDARYSRFDGVQVGQGIYLQSGTNAVLIGCTVNGNGLGANPRADSGGMVLVSNTTARIVGTTFIGNLNSGLIAHDSARVEMSGSYSANSIQGNGALFFGATTAILSGNTFANNGRTFGAVSGFNGVEFYVNFVGYASVTGNNFRGNTANGLFIGSAPNLIRVVGNVFDSNLIGLNFFAETNAANVQILGNRFRVPANLGQERFGVAGVGRLVNAQIGGSGAEQNVFDDFPNYLSIDPSHTGGTPLQNLGCPNFVILGNIYRRNGVALDPALATHPC
ncbi:right-handed parallel beta-helix repeat-containing protein [Paludisphaera soli]|uniref:right-handed parallel beta-helix repeat-containing protein n=1 Tax=Paludisphaera soli TaxID=2712865 RepID=UPI0013EA8108|nr:right-handed parallel beta-helix repeat-containing protein [Paludisphaera soli]